jgi:hypothetical protein
MVPSPTPDTSRKRHFRRHGGPSHRANRRRPASSRGEDTAQPRSRPTRAQGRRPLAGISAASADPSPPSAGDRARSRGGADREQRIGRAAGVEPGARRTNSGNESGEVRWRPAVATASFRALGPRSAAGGGRSNATPGRLPPSPACCEHGIRIALGRRGCRRLERSKLRSPFSRVFGQVRPALDLLGPTRTLMS